MGPAMYKQRPAYPALIGAIVVICFGVAVTMNLNDQVNEGLAEPRAVIMAAAVTIVVSGSLLIAAFARYQYTHLWKREAPSHSGRRGHSRSVRR